MLIVNKSLHCSRCIFCGYLKVVNYLELDWNFCERGLNGNEGVMMGLEPLQIKQVYANRKSFQT